MSEEINFEALYNETKGKIDECNTLITLLSNDNIDFKSQSEDVKEFVRYKYNSLVQSGSTAEDALKSITEMPMLKTKNVPDGIKPRTNIVRPNEVSKYKEAFDEAKGKNNTSEMARLIRLMSSEK